MENKFLYWIIAYKDDQTNTCRGCVMEQYGSQFIYEQNIYHKQVLKELTDIAYHNIKNKNVIGGDRQFDSITILRSDIPESVDCDYDNIKWVKIGGEEFNSLYKNASEIALRRISDEKQQELKEEKKKEEEIKRREYEDALKVIQKFNNEKAN